MNKKETFISMTNDYVFTEVMKQPKVLKGFLSAVLRVPAEELSIKEVLIKNRYLSKHSPTDKLGILDVHAEILGRGTFAIEMQATLFPFWENRSIYYTCKAFTEGGQSGKGYAQFQKTVSISIMGYNLIKDTDYFYSSYKFREDRRYTVYSDLLEIHVIELMKLKNRRPNPEDEVLYRWACLLNVKSKEEAQMLEKDPYIEEALKELERLSLDPKRREEYEIRDRNLRDYVTMTNYMKKTGYEEGKEKGIEEGREEGREEGKIQEKKDSAINAIKMGLTNTQIQTITGLSENDIESIRKSQ